MTTVSLPVSRAKAVELFAHAIRLNDTLSEDADYGQFILIALALDFGLTKDEIWEKVISHS
jgi:hypothetical protein